MKIICFAPFFAALTSADTSRNRLREHQVSSKAAKPSTSPTQTNYPSSLPSTPSPNVSGPLSAKTAKSSGGGCGPDDPLSCYEFVGAGECANSSGYKFFSWTGWDISSFGDGQDRSIDLADCASTCSDCVDGQITGGLFRGFEIKASADYGDTCRCLYDSNGTHTNQSCGPDGAFAGEGGTGPITQFFSPDTNFVCYKIKEE